MRRAPLLLGLLLVISCATSRARPVAPSQELTFLDSEAFDEQLRTALANGAVSVTVRFAAPITPNALPERLDRWLSTVASRYRAPVQVLPDPTLPRSRDLVAGAALALSLASTAYEGARERALYGAAEGYGVLVFVDPESGVISRLAFVRRPEGT